MFCSIPGIDIIYFNPGATPPIWSCHPPPVDIICSIASTWRYKSLSVCSIPINPNTAFTHAADKIEDVPRPEPFGTFVTSLCIIKPPPRRSNISCKLCPFWGMTPHASKHAFWSANESNGSPVLCKGSISSNSPWTSISLLSNTILYSGILSTVTSTGFSPLRRIAIFRTVPPHSLQYGGVSLHPPPQFTRRGSSTVYLSVAIFNSSLYFKCWRVAPNIVLSISLKQFWISKSESNTLPK